MFIGTIKVVQQFVLIRTMLAVLTYNVFFNFLSEMNVQVCSCLKLKSCSLFAERATGAERECRVRAVMLL